MLRPLLVTLALAFALVPLAGFDCGGNHDDGGEGEGEGEGSHGEGEGEGAHGEGEGEGAHGEGEGEGEGSSGDSRTFTCQDGTTTVVSQTSCSSDSDCGVGVIGLDCCGSQRATGVNAGDICSFMPAAGACWQATCDCAAQATVADDGSTAKAVGDTPLVQCIQGQCTTTFP